LRVASLLADDERLIKVVLVLTLRNNNYYPKALGTLE
jgi:hypothetical protein